MIAGVENKMGHVTLSPDHAFLGWFVIQKIGFDTVYHFTCMQTLTILALAVSEISHWKPQNLK